MSNKASTRKDDQYEYSIAIIGGGFSGLTLANYLVAGTVAGTCQCRVLEAKEEPIPIVGTIRLPHARQVLEELNLLNDNAKESSSLYINRNAGTELVDRQAFQRLLRKNISVEYSCRIFRIERRHNGKYWLICDDDGYDDDKGQERKQHGPFECVVVANGLCIGKSSPTFLAGDPPSAVLGDARWQYDTWFWDFGRQRIQKGGDIALCDAIELAQALLPSIQAWLSLSDENNKAIVNNNPLLQIPHKFQPRPSTIFHHRWHASKLVFFCAIVAILFRILLGLEKL